MKEKIKKVLKSILLEKRPKEYCHGEIDGEISVSFNYKNSRIQINHYFLYETKKIKKFFCTREEKYKTEDFVTHIHIYPNDRGIDNSYFKYENDTEILTWIKKYIERYNNSENEKRNNFLNSLLDEN